MGAPQLSPRGMARAILDMRTDPAFGDSYTEDDYDFMERRTKQLFQSGELDNVETYKRPGDTPDLRNYRVGCSQLNLLKLGKLRLLNRSYYDLLESIMARREAKNVDAAVGRDLDELLSWSDKGEVSTGEHQRLTRRHREDPSSVWVAICCHWHGGNFCKLHDECPMWHVDAK